MMKRRETKYLIAAAIVILVSFSHTMADPLMYVPESAFDFGYVAPKAVVSHVFWLKSMGDEDLRILKVTPGCGCTQTPLATDSIGPGDSTHIEIIFSTGKYRKNTSKRTRLQTNESSEFFNLLIEAYVLPEGDSTYPLSLSSFVIDLSPLSDKPRLVAPLTITNLSSEKMSVQLIDTYDQLFTIELPDDIEPGQTGGGAVHLTDLGAKSDFSKSFTIEADNFLRSRYTISVTRLSPQDESPDK